MLYARYRIFLQTQGFLVAASCKSRPSNRVLVQIRTFVTARNVMPILPCGNCVVLLEKKTTCCEMFPGARFLSNFEKTGTYLNRTNTIEGCEKNNIDKLNLPKVLAELENLKNEGDLKGAIGCFNQLQLQNPDWVKHWPSQRIAALILHVYFRAGLHEALLDLYSNLHRMGLQHGEGIYSTLIKSCLAIEDWNRAFEYFKHMKSKGLRNIRIYPELIKVFAERKKLDLAYKTFEEMKTQELNQKTRKQLNDQRMLIILIEAATEHHLKMEVNDDELPMKTVTSIFHYLEERCLTLSQKLSHVILKWLDLQRYWSAEVIEMHSRGSLPPSLKHSEEEFNHKEIKNFMTGMKSSMQIPVLVEELVKLEEFLDQQGPFQVIVDGANVMFANEKGRKSKDMHLQPSNLMNLLHNFSKNCSRILVILPQSVERRSNFKHGDYYRTLTIEMEVQFMFTRDLSDDIAVLYAALHSESSENSKNVMLLTNDSLRDHVPLLKRDQWKFLNWIRSRQVRFHWNEHHKISILENRAPHYRLQNAWIFPRDDGKLIHISEIS